MPFLRAFGSLTIALLTADTAQAGVDFKKEILPVLENHCLKCHSATHEVKGKTLKPKGDIRLDAAWALLTGDKDVVPVRPGDVANSDLVRVVTLPRDDDLAMPPEGKGDPLTATEIATLKTWIAGGAEFGGWEGNLEGKPAPAAIVTRGPAKERAHDLFYQKLSVGLQAPPEDALKTARTAGAQVVPLTPESPLLRVDFLTGVTQCDDASIAALAPLAGHIAHLDLGRTKITDAACKSIARMPRLTRLDLRGTQVTDAGISQLRSLENVAYLNLYGVRITDQVLPSLAAMKSLKSICIFETGTTEAGRKMLQAALPGAEIVFDLELPAAAEKARVPKKAK